MRFRPSRSLSEYLNRVFRTRVFLNSEIDGLVIVMVSICVVLGVAELGGDPLRRAWALERGAVLDGQVWRLVTAQMVHLSSTHTILNILGLVLVTVTIWSGLSPAGLIRAVLFSGAAIVIGWMVLQPNGPTYVGFSGITHGIYAFGALVMLRRGPVWIGWVVLFCLTLKLGQEYFNGPVPGAEGEIGGSVSLISHTLGTFGGAMAALRYGPTWACVIVLIITAALTFSHAEAKLFSQAFSAPIFPHQTG